MRIAILIEGEGPTPPGGWPSQADAVHHAPHRGDFLARMPDLARDHDILLVTPAEGGDRAALADALGSLDLFTVEVQPGKPAAPAGADALFWGLGAEGYAAAITLVGDRGP